MTRLNDIAEVDSEFRFVDYGADPAIWIESDRLEECMEFYRNNHLGGRSRRCPVKR